ncbi:MAG: histidine phosphatase family protein [Bacillota bacterium]|nr:histidine phosphatase family protein [Bacillota bacterium]
MRFYLIRHGETLFNVKGQIQGWCDSPLTKKGIEQVQDARKKVENVDFVAGYSSTAERAKDTLHIVFEGRDIPQKHLKGLREIYTGELEGEPESMYAKLGINYFDGFKAQGGESFDEALDRFISTLQELEKKHPEGNVCICGHGGVMMATVFTIDPSYKAIFEEKGGLKNGSVTIIEMEKGEMKLISVGE